MQQRHFSPATPVGKSEAAIAAMNPAHKLEKCFAGHEIVFLHVSSYLRNGQPQHSPLAASLLALSRCFSEGFPTSINHLPLRSLLACCCLNNFTGFRVRSTKARAQENLPLDCVRRIIEEGNSCCCLIMTVFNDAPHACQVQNTTSSHRGCPKNL